MTAGDGPTALIPVGLRAALVLVRHGETPWVAEDRFQGRLDPPLSELGRRQAELTAARLDPSVERSSLPIPAGPPLAVWHSPLSRARQTAEAIGARAGAPDLARSEPLLTEIGAGAWEGLLNSEVAVRYGPVLAAWRREPTRATAPGGEPLLDAAARVRQALGTILAGLARAGDGDGGEPAAAAGPAPRAWSIVVAHDGILRLALMTLLAIPYDRFWSFPFSLCGISVVELRDERAVLRAHNLADHLAPLARDPAAAAEARGDRRGTL